jgi:Flp pilus assembly pilin Flp
MTTRRGLVRTGRHEAGASAVEYAILVAGLAIALVVVAGLLQATVRGAYTAAGVQIAASPASTAGGGSTSAPATPSATPTTATPTATPTTPSASPTPTRPPGSISVARGRSASDVEIDVPGGAKDVTGTTSPEDQGTVTIDDGELVFTPKASATPGVVTVTWTYTKGGKTYVGGTVTYWVT